MPCMVLWKLKVSDIKSMVREGIVLSGSLGPKNENSISLELVIKQR